MSEIIWQSVLDQLKAAMPRSAFDTWVVDTHFVSSNGTLFIVGCRNAGSRDWLESRVQTTVDHLLRGMLNHLVTVSFVVTGDPVDEPGSDGPELADDDVQVEAVWDSLYEQIVQPEKAIALNAYFLRHLRELGPELGWLYVGFRQSAYSAGGRNGQRTARFAGKIVATLSGMSERTFWRRVGNPETWQKLAGLVNLVDEKPLWDEKSATPKRLPRKYSVSMTLPLTATDARSLMRWIAEHMTEAGGPAGVLEMACKTPVEEIIPLNVASVVGSEPLPISQIVRELFADEIPEAELKALIERLQMHLMPSGDLIMISLFFVEHVLPHLGAGPGWMLTILRDRCWVNPESGEARNRVTVKGGYAEIASWLGLERPLTVYEWLHGRHKTYLLSKSGEGGKKANPKAGKYINSPFRVYVREVADQRVASFRDGSRDFDVLLDEIPQEIMTAIVLQKRPSLYGSDSIAITELSDDLYGIVSIGFTELTEDIYGNDSIALTELADDLYGNGRVLKLLNSLKPALKTPLKPTTPENGKKLEEAQKGVVDEKWDLSSLFRANSVSRKKQKQLFDCGANEQAFASWILYGYTPAGRGLTDLVGNAIQNTISSPNSGAGGICDLLAEYGPTKLASLLTDSIRGAMVADNGFLSAFGHLSITQKQELLMRLGQKQVDVQKRIPAYPVYEKPTSPDIHIRELLQNRAGKPNFKNVREA